MKPIYLSLLLLSLLFTGVVEAKDWGNKTAIPCTCLGASDGECVPGSEKCSMDIQVRGGTEGRTVLRNDRSSAPVAARAVTQAGYPLHGQPVSSPVPSPKKVIFDYDDVIKIMADKEHREKLLHQCKAGDAILVQIGKEKDHKIELLEGQVKNLLETAETQERLGATEAQINEALQKQLNKVTADLDAEKSKKYWWAGGSAVSSAAIVTAIFLWVVN